MSRKESTDNEYIKELDNTYSLSKGYVWLFENELRGDRCVIYDSLNSFILREKEYALNPWTFNGAQFRWLDYTVTLTPQKIISYK